MKFFVSMTEISLSEKTTPRVVFSFFLQNLKQSIKKMRRHGMLSTKNSDMELISQDGISTKLRPSSS